MVKKMSPKLISRYFCAASSTVCGLFLVSCSDVPPDAKGPQTTIVTVTQDAATEHSFEVGGEKQAGAKNEGSGRTLETLQEKSPEFLGILTTFKFTTGGPMEVCRFTDAHMVFCTGKTPPELPEIRGLSYNGPPVSIGVKNQVPMYSSGNGLPVPEVIEGQLREGEKVTQGSNTCGMIDASTLHCRTAVGNFWIKGPESEITTDMDPKN